MAKKSSSKGKAPEVPIPGAHVVTGNEVPEPTVEVYEGEKVQVNNASLSELKHACDDYIQEYFSRPGAFKASHTYEDLHLAVGWTACLIAGGISLYGWYVPFVKSKPWIMLGVIAYALLSSVLWLHQNYIVKDTVFQGKRKTVSGRIETQTLSIASKLLTKPVADPPLQLSLKYAHSANGGKSVLGTAEGTATLGFGEVFDAEGMLHKDKLRAILANLESDVVQN